MVGVDLLDVGHLISSLALVEPVPDDGAVLLRDLASSVTRPPPS
jgi:hypothetical protein